MNDPSPHDPRLVYIACAWLVAHRGHFLSEISLDNVSSLDDVSELYKDLMDYMAGEAVEEDGETQEQSEPMWTCDPKTFGDILAERMGLSQKREKMVDVLWGGKKTKSDGLRYNRMDIISLLCGSETVKPSSLFVGHEEYKEMSQLSLGAEDEKLEAQIAELGDDGTLIRKLKALYDWAVLRDVRRGKSCISEAKVAIYEQHRKDLLTLKAFLKKTDRKLFKKVFVKADEKTPNYTSYVYNAKAVKKAKKEEFSEWLIKELKAVRPDDSDRAFYDDMMARLATCSFLPKQIDGDNRVIPHQLYRFELRKILANAQTYLPFLLERDENGSVAEKIESVFTFRVPYFVGPLVLAEGERGKFAWMVRKREGVIRPWNFDKLVDLDKSEDAFIARMTNTCTYIPGEDVLAADSLLYKEFMLLNEINPLKIAGAKITPELKMRIVDELFRHKRKVSLKALKSFLAQANCMRTDDELSGIDEAIKSNLSSYHDFRGWLDKGKLTKLDVEAIIQRSVCTEDTHRLEEWISRQKFASNLEEGAVKKIARLKYTGFGRFSRRFLEGVKFINKETGECGTVMDFLRRENVVLMELLSSKYTLREELDGIAAKYYSSHEMTLEKRLDEMYVSSAVKRQIYRALDVVRTVCKIMGHAPAKVFVEMARGASPDQRGKRTKTRYDQLQNLYKGVRDFEVKEVNRVLAEMGDTVHNRLQADALFLWTLQLGHCAYCGKSLPVESLKSVANIDHIHPQSKVKDDSVMNNKVLCCSTCNDTKKDSYPIPDVLRRKDLWNRWHSLGLMTDEKYRRLCRHEALTEDELQGFINRQLVETRQTTKAVFTILGETLPDTEIIAVKAGNVSDFRHEFGLVKSRAINDLHHAKDAYLNIVVGNVYHEKFSRQFFRLSDGYSMKVGTLFGEGSHIENAHGLAWNGVASLVRVKETIARNDVHLTKYAYYAKGGLFDQMPKGPGESTIPRKRGLSAQKYGGYAKPAAAGYILAKFTCGKKSDIMLVPISLLDFPIVTGGGESAAKICIARTIAGIEGKEVSIVGLPLGRKVIKVNSMISLDGFPYIIRAKSGGGKAYVLGLMRSLVLRSEEERYVKRLESVSEKLKQNRNLVIDETYDKVTRKRNEDLYGTLAEIVASPIYATVPASQARVLTLGNEIFKSLDIRAQIKSLMSIVQLLKTNRAGGCDLTGIGGAPTAGVLQISSKLSNWKKSFSDARLLFVDFTGMYSTMSDNLLDML